MSADIRCLVTGATGYIGGRLVPQLLDAGLRVRALARNPDKLADAPWRDRRGGGTGRPDPARIACRGVPRRRRRLLPGALDGHVEGFRRRGAAVGPQRRRRGKAGGRAQAGVPERPSSRGCRSVPSPEIAHRGRRDPHRLRYRDRGAAGRNRDRLGFSVVRDDPSPHRPATRDDDAEVGAQQDPADRGRRHPLLPRGPRRPTFRRRAHGTSAVRT